MSVRTQLRDDFDAVAVRWLAKASKDAAQTRRLMALAAIYDGVSHLEAARIGGVTPQIVRDWVVRFNARGDAGLISGHAGGRASKLTDDHRRALAKMVDDGPDPAVDGVVRWRLKDLAAWLGDSIRGSHQGQRSCAARNRFHEGFQRAAFQGVLLVNRPGDFMMTQTPAALSQPIAPDYDSTLVLSVELSNTSWVLAAQVPGLPRLKAKRSIEPTAEALMTAIDAYRARAREAGRIVERVVAVYEAGWSGFWLARWLERRGIEIHVIQPASVPVDRRARRAKSDGIDAELLLRTLLAWLRGEPRVCSMVPIPAEADEDARRFIRERAELVAERVSLVNRIGAVLATLGDTRLQSAPSYAASLP